MPILEEPIALTPKKGGGRCIGEDALEKGDIIVSTTKAATSGLIRIATISPVSHAALYAGDGNVIEAIGRGVTLHSLSEALKDDALAVAYRNTSLSAADAERVVQFATAQVNKPYNTIGAALSIDPIKCRLFGAMPAGFFCSQLVIEAFKRAGAPLTGDPSQCVTPDDVVTIAQNQLTYLGHLLGDPSWLPMIAP